MVWYSHLFKSFPQFIMMHTVKGFSVADETQVDAFLAFLCFLYDPFPLTHGYYMWPATPTSSCQGPTPQLPNC